MRGQRTHAFLSADPDRHGHGDVHNEIERRKDAHGHKKEEGNAPDARMVHPEGFEPSAS